MHSPTFYKTLSCELDKIMYNLHVAQLRKIEYNVPHFTITEFLYRLRFCPNFNLKATFYRLVELGYNPFRLGKCDVEKLYVKNIVKVIDNLKEV